jgi:cystathionine beta-lyase
MAEICLRRGVLIVSDEIHCDLLYPGHRHTPVASLDPEIARHSITLIAPSKTYNLAGLQCAVAIIPDQTLRRSFQAAGQGLTPWVNLMGVTAAQAAYAEGQEWLAQLLSYLDGNRRYLANFVRQELPGIEMAPPEGTYLAWLDCRAAGLPGSPYQFSLEHARVALNEGAEFGRGGEGFARLNFGCPRPMLQEALEKMAAALQTGRGG